LYRLAGGASLRDEGEGLYWRYETFLKRQESWLHSILGGHGAFYAIRKALFRPLDGGAINDDYVIPMRVVEQGFRAVYEPSAVAWERELASMEGEFARRRRIAAGNCQQLAALWRLLDPRRGWVALEFGSHKVLRTFAPVFLLTLLAATPWLSASSLAWALAGQGLLYGSAVAGYLCQRRGVVVRWLSPPLYFCLGNLAMLAGIIRFGFTRGRPIAWERAR
jgi:cellulose synthase/poly-beta-1,6-N-acetylglucosamine synthase-like glycosyltransferase